MTDPVEVIARAIEPDAWLAWGYDLHANVQRRNSALRTARSALSALEREGMAVGQGWQPIETAPEYGRILVCLNPERYGIPVHIWELDRIPADAEIVGWMPLPRPPEPR